MRDFELVCELQPPARPDLSWVKPQLAGWAAVADAFLVPDSHLGRATVSSLAVAHEVRKAGTRAVACLNARDRNLLGMRRDLLTAAAYGIDELLLVHGDQPKVGQRAGAVSVRQLLEETRRCADDEAYAGRVPFRVGVTGSVRRRLPEWKRNADFVCCQVVTDVAAACRWRESVPAELPVYVGVLVLRSAAMARRLAGIAPDLVVDADLVARVEKDPSAGVPAAAALVEELRGTGAFAGAHVIAAGRHEELVRALRVPPRSGDGVS